MSNSDRYGAGAAFQTDWAALVPGRFASRDFRPPIDAIASVRSSAARAADAAIRPSQIVAARSRERLQGLPDGRIAASAARAEATEMQRTARRV